ncbi:hypothetical protein MLD38_030046 [Melastoma candidum]|uniref:Uncharacterized protein n=1 Tax=Melastoma candidum TaxID=119954 RepID=A0ACB9MK45_9MYRT|nr:hypothetical protein MLD38_030046 [Melastoma candidum]
MKGGGGGDGGKRRWRGLAFGVLALVVLSMLVPLSFLLGRFHSSYAAFVVSDQLNFATNAFWNYDKYESGFTRNRSKSQKDQSSHVKDLLKQLGPNISKDVMKNIESGTKTHTSTSVFQLHLKLQSRTHEKRMAYRI